MRQPAHAYSSLSITIHHRAGKQFAEAREISPAPSRRRICRWRPGASRSRSRPAAKHPCGVKTPGSVGAPPCLTAARSACAGSFPLGRRAVAAPALAAVPLAGLPARGKLVRQMSARAVPEALRAERSASAERGGWPDLCAECGPDRLWSAGCGPARADRLCRSGYRPARCSSRTGRMAAAAREESPPSRAARRTSRAAARSRTSGPVADQRAGRGPRD